MIQFHELPACAEYYRAPALDNAVGLVPMFLSESDPRSAKEQLNENYAHGGGWRPRGGSGFKVTSTPVPEGGQEPAHIPSIKYPGDPALPPLAYAMLRDEMIVVYPSAWVMIAQRDGSYEIARMD